ncbi:MAG: radical SAM protein [Firmicutes bacterium]|nr:radical SAM protein [Bacillota bacterium]
MEYESPLYRPPSESNSLILQITIGCSHNKCTFCSMYKGKKFRIKSLDEIKNDIRIARKTYSNVKRIFLADGNALVLKTKKLKEVLSEINSMFPECERIGIYTAPKDILLKSITELKELKKLGIKIAYLGIESGNNDVLKNIKKGVSSNELRKAGKRIVSSGIKLSVTLISGLGGKSNWKQHATDSARLINDINPDYLALLTLLINNETELYEKIENNEFNLLSPKEVLLETKLLISNLTLDNCIFRSNHPSNYVPLAGFLSKDKNLLLDTIDEALKQDYDFKNEYLRRL